MGTICLDLEWGTCFCTYQYQGRLLWDRKTENKAGFPFVVLNPARSALGSDESFLFAAYTRKIVLFGHSTSPLPRVLASQDTGDHQTWRLYAPLSCESSLPSLVVTRVLRGEESWQRWSVLCEKHVFFAVRAGCGTEQEKPEPCVGFNTTRGKTCFVFLFSDPIIIALIQKHQTRATIRVLYLF